MTKQLERFVYWVSSYGSGADVDAACALEGPVGLDEKNEDGEDFVLAQTNGDLVSFIEIRGARKYVGRNDLVRVIENFDKSLTKLFRAGNGNQFSISIGFRSDPFKSDKVIGWILAPQMATAKRFGITNTRMLRARKETLASHCADETVYLVLRTHRLAMQPHEKKAQAEERIKLSAQVNSQTEGLRLSGLLSQKVSAPLMALSPRHAAAVRSLCDDLSRDLDTGGAQLLVKLLGNHAALRMVRSHLDADQVVDDWRPRLLGDSAAALGSSAKPRANEADAFLPSRLSRQMLNSSVHDIFDTRELARKDETWYASCVLELCPDEGSEPFQDLAQRIGKRMPWRVAFEISPNGTNYRAMERYLVPMLGAFSDYNKSIRKAFNAFKEIKERGDYVAALRATFTTWGDTKQAAVQNLANLQSAIQSWGSAACTNELGEPGRAVLASAAGFSALSPAPYLPAPMLDIAAMMPVARPASLWDRGQIVFATTEGRPYPVEFGSRLQSYWSTIGFAPPGSGKSFSLNVLNSGLLLAPGAIEVPPITLVDVGLSGKLVMDWFRSILPEHMRDQVLSLSIRNDEHHVTNPFDTQLGLEDPLSAEEDFLVAVLGTIAQGCGPEADKFFIRVIRASYEKFGRNSPDAKRWQSALDPKVSRALDSIGFVVSEKTTAWSVVDALFDAGMISDATSAQRFAMPIMQDLPRIAADAKVANLYGSAMHGGERIIDVFTRHINAGLQSYQLLSGYTRLNLGAARAVSIDLQEVIGSSNEEGRRKSGLMFLLARFIGARNYFLKWDEMENVCPARYASYQQKRVAKLWETMKFLQYDEAHYCSGIESVARLMSSDLRTGRKFNLITALFSQMLKDFSEDVVENTYNIFIMGVGDSSPDSLRKTFGLSADEMKAIQEYCIRPGVMFARFKTQRGTLSQVVHLHASAYEKWAFTTQGRDQALRAALAKLMPYSEVLDLLTDEFPDGSAETHIRKFQAARQEDMQADDESLAMLVARELLKKWSRL